MQRVRWRNIVVVLAIAAPRSAWQGGFVRVDVQYDSGIRF